MDALDTSSGEEEEGNVMQPLVKHRWRKHKRRKTNRGRCKDCMAFLGKGDDGRDICLRCYEEAEETGPTVNDFIDEEAVVDGNDSGDEGEDSESNGDHLQGFLVEDPGDDSDDDAATSDMVVCYNCRRSGPVTEVENDEVNGDLESYANLVMELAPVNVRGKRK